MRGAGGPDAGRGRRVTLLARAAIGESLARDAASRVRDRLETLGRDRVAAVDATTVRALADARERILDCRELVLERELLGDELFARVQIGRDVRGMLRRRGVLALVVDVSAEGRDVARDLAAELAAQDFESLLEFVHGPQVAAPAWTGEVPQDTRRQGIRPSCCQARDASLGTTETGVPG